VTRSPTSDCTVQPELSGALTEYVDRLLLSTGLHAEDALRIASGQLDPPDELAGLALALRAGWDLTEDRS
jgi:hypothetical protein